VHFNSHTDVVEVGKDWTMDPSDGDLFHGKIYGRGACDMKGGLARVCSCTNQTYHAASRRNP